MENQTITLGGKEYPIAPLTLGQMRHVAPCLMRMGIDTVDGMGANVTIIYHGMKAADASVKVEDIDAMTGVTFAEIKNAVEKIAIMAGLELKKAAPEGEAKPAGEPAAASEVGTGDSSAQN